MNLVFCGSVIVFLLTLATGCPTIYVSSRNSTVYIIDGSNDTLETTSTVIIPSSGYIEPISINPNGLFYYVGQAGSTLGRTIFIINTSSNLDVGNLTLANETGIYSLITDSAGDILYAIGSAGFLWNISISNNGSTLAVATTFPILTLVPTCSETQYMYLTGDNKLIFIGCQGGTVGVLVFNTSSKTIQNQMNIPNTLPNSQVQQITGPIGNTYNSTFYGATQSNIFSFTYTTINITKISPPFYLPGGAALFSLATSPDNQLLFIPDGNVPSGNVTILNATTLTLVGNISGFGNSPYNILLSPTNAKFYVTNFGSTNISVLNITTQSVLSTITLPNSIGSTGLAILHCPTPPPPPPPPPSTNLALILGVSIGGGVSLLIILVVIIGSQYGIDNVINRTSTQKGKNVKGRTIRWFRKSANGKEQHSA